MPTGSLNLGHQVLTLFIPPDPSYKIIREKFHVEILLEIFEKKLNHKGLEKREEGRGGA